MHSRYVIGASLLAITATAQAQAQASAPAGEEEIVVTGQRAQQERAIAIKRDAIGIVDVAASDEIGRLPDRNVAEVVERLPGVGVTYDQGEGRYVAIRGVTSALNGYTVNGIELGNPDGLTRALPLDVISGQLLNRVEVVKVKTADLNAQGIGGTINLVTQTAFDFREPFALQVNAQAGYQELNDKVPVRGDASVGGRFGVDEQFGLLLGASYSDRTFASYGIYPDDWRPLEGAARGGLPINIKYTDYSLKRERIGATGSFDWRPRDGQQFYVRGIYSRFTEDEYRQRYRLDFATNGIVKAGNLTLNPDGLTGSASGTERRQDLRLEYKEKSVLAGMIGGSSRFEALKLDYVLARVHNEVIEPNRLWQFRGNPGVVDFDFGDVNFTAAPRTELTPDQLGFRQYAEQDERGEEDIWQARLDATYALGGLGSESFLKAGGGYRGTDKGFDAENRIYTRGSSPATRFTLGQFDLAGAAVNVYPAGDGRAYVNAPTIDADKIIAFTAANLSGPFFMFDEEGTLEDGTLSDFDLDEEIWAAYAMANLRFGIATLTPGLRYERTSVDITGFRLDEEGMTAEPARGEADYQNWLPSLILRLEPSRDLIFRLAYSRSLGRPEYARLNPGGSIAYEEGSTPGTFEGSVSLGNPDLRPYRSDNLDASAEYYFARGGLVAVAAFAKFIEDPIFTQSYTQNDVSFGGRQYERLEFSQPLNADSGRITGIEAAFQQQFTFLPSFLSGFGIELNAALIDSELKTPDRGTTAFPSQSDYLYGAQLFYQTDRFEASIAYHNTGKSLLSLGDEPFEDQYNNDLRRLDAKASFALLPNVRVFAEAQNLTDEPTRQYQGGREDWNIQNERYGRTVYGGLSVRF